MKKLTSIVILLAAALAPPLAVAQISNPVNGFRTDLKQGILWNGMRPFVGEFRFDPLPAPLAVSTVHFTLEAVEARSVFPATDPWVLRLMWDPKDFDIIGDTLFYWGGNHEPGDRFTGSFRIVPRTSGYNGFTLRADGGGRGALTVVWNLDLGGQLQFLGKGEDKANVLFSPFNPTFFAGDSVHIEQAKREHSPGLFYYEIDIIPPFRVGDTSTVRYGLTALGDLPDGVKSQFQLNHFELVGLPPVVAGPIRIGDVITVEAKVVPLPVANVHELYYYLHPAGGGSGKPVNIEALFSDDGSLSLVGDVNLNSVNQKYWPTAFPRKAYDDVNIPVFYIKPDGSVWNQHSEQISAPTR